MATWRTAVRNKIKGIEISDRETALQFLQQAPSARTPEQQAELLEQCGYVAKGLLKRAERMRMYEQVSQIFRETRRKLSGKYSQFLE